MPPFASPNGSAATPFLINSHSSSPHFSDCKGKIKCVLVGDGAVGKTSLIVSYTTNGYPTEYQPTAYDNYNVVVNVDNQPIRLQLCDTAGQDDFDSLRPLCYPDTDVFLVCFSVVSPTSFHNVTEKWLPELRRHCPSTPFVLVGTQCDLRSDVKVLIDLARFREQPVSEAEARRLAQKVGAYAYIESSALTERNLKEVFDTSILCALKHNQELNRLTLSKTRGKKWLLFNDKSKVGDGYAPCPPFPTRGKKRRAWWKKLFCAFS